MTGKAGHDPSPRKKSTEPAPKRELAAANLHCSCVFEERQFTIAEIARMWKLSPDAVRRLFKRLPGVFVLHPATSRSSRKYDTIRVPESVFGSRYCQHFISISGKKA